MASALIASDPTSLPPAAYREVLREYLTERCLEQLEDLVLKATAGPSGHFGFPVDCHDLLDYDPAMGFLVVHHPKHMLPIFDEAVWEAQRALLNAPAFHAKHPGKTGTQKKFCHVRVVSLPPTEYLCKATISDIRAEDISGLIQLSGTVVRTSAVRMLDQSKEYECQNPRCRLRFSVYADPEQDYMMPQPRVCPGVVQSRSTNDAGAQQRPCGSTTLRELEGSRVCVDYQELRLQDSFEKLPLGSVPRSITVVLEADLVDRFNPGEVLRCPLTPHLSSPLFTSFSRTCFSCCQVVTVVGSLLRQWRPVRAGTRCAVDLCVRANRCPSPPHWPSLSRTAPSHTCTHYNPHRCQ